MRKMKSALSVAGLLVMAGFSAPLFAWPHGPGPGRDYPWGPPFVPWGEVIIDYPPPPPHVIYVEPPHPQAWVEKAPHYRYYCPDPAGYYPQIARCPRGWMKVVADHAQPDREDD
ncbi:hypothetical protein [Gibbsiella quercinecans]|uniref:hypothetical protein n=1 Tax=Gibbsiella quercinecans TaxID=929813 RepID=UPI00242D0ED8|nr:hypothetical protein [Gibbsiella quercinecans]